MAVKDPSTGYRRILTFEESLALSRNYDEVRDRPNAASEQFLKERMPLLFRDSPYNDRLYGLVAEDLNREALVRAGNEKSKRDYTAFSSQLGVPPNVAAVVADAGPVPPPAGPAPAPMETEAPPPEAASGSRPRMGRSVGPKATISKWRRTSLAHIPQSERDVAIRDQLELQRIAQERAVENVAQNTAMQLRSAIDQAAVVSRANATIQVLQRMSKSPGPPPPRQLTLTDPRTNPMASSLSDVAPFPKDVAPKVSYGPAVRAALRDARSSGQTGLDALGPVPKQLTRPRATSVPASSSVQTQLTPDRGALAQARKRKAREVAREAKEESRGRSRA